MVLSIFKTQGHSMEPIIGNGSFFIVSSIPLKLFDIKKDDIILFKKDKKNIVKKIVRIDHDKIFIEGENILDNRKFDPIDKKEILGKVIWIL